MTFQEPWRAFAERRVSRWQCSSLKDHRTSCANPAPKPVVPCCPPWPIGKITHPKEVSFHIITHGNIRDSILYVYVYVYVYAYIIYNHIQKITSYHKIMEYRAISILHPLSISGCRFFTPSKQISANEAATKEQLNLLRSSWPGKEGAG